MSNRKYPSAEYLRECFRYEDGKLFWISRPLNHFSSEKGWQIFESQHVGDEAGSVQPCCGGNFRRFIGIDGQLNFRARVVWAFHYNEWPRRIDHKDRDTLNDRLENLRPCTRSQNGQNAKRRPDNTSGFKGVSCHKKTGKFQSRIRVDGKLVYLGLFSDPKEAHAAYVKAANHCFGEFACTG